MSGRFEHEIISFVAGRWDLVFRDDSNSGPPAFSTKPIVALAAVREYEILRDPVSGERTGRRWVREAILPADLNAEGVSCFDICDCTNYLGVIPAGEDPYASQWGLCPADVKRPGRNQKKRTKSRRSGLRNSASPNLPPNEVE